MASASSSTAAATATAATQSALPALSPPPGHISDFQRQTPYLNNYIAGETVTQPFLMAVVLIRLYTQHCISDGIVTEDFIMIVGYLFQFATVAVGYLCIHSGSGAHMWDLTQQTFNKLFKYFFIYSILYNAVLAFIKTAILLQFLRILVPYRGNKPAWFACWVCIVVNAVFYTTTIITQIFQCSPVEKKWSPSTIGHCLNLAAMYKASGVFNAMSDFAVLIIPIPIIFRLNMSLRKKLGINTLFAAGLLACVTSGVRAYYSWLVFDSADMSIYFWPVGLWSQFEMSTGFFVFCLPILPKFYLFIRRKILKLRTTNLDPSAVSAEREQPRRTQEIYELPSLASFEQREALPKITAIHLTSVVERDTASSHHSDPELPHYPDLASSKGTLAPELG